jgi:hypothetical protein
VQALWVRPHPAKHLVGVEGAFGLIAHG